MRSVSLAAVLTMAVGVTPAFAQAAGQRPAPQPRAQQPVTPQATAPAPVPAAQPPAPFPADAKIAVVNLQQIANLSAEGKAAQAKIQDLLKQKQTEEAAKTKQLQDNQTKLAQGGALLSQAARDQLQKDIDRQTVDNQRFEQDAQTELNQLQAELQADFQRKLLPVLEQMRKDMKLHLLLSVQDAGVVAVEPGIDLTMEAVKRLDASEKAAAKPAAAAPAAPAKK
jgi:outer membrane protein